MAHEKPYGVYAPSVAGAHNPNKSMIRFCQGDPCMLENSCSSVLTRDLIHAIHVKGGVVHIPAGYDAVVGAYEGDDGLTYVILPEGMRCIGERAFSCCGRLEGINIPSSVIAIGDYALSSCHELKEIALPLGVKRVGKCAFAHCDGLRRLSLPPSIEEIGEDAFIGCSSDLVYEVEAGSFAHRYLQLLHLPRVTLRVW